MSSSSLKKLLNSGGNIKSKSSRRHLRLLSEPASKLPANELISQQNKFGRSIKRFGDVIFSSFI